MAAGGADVLIRTLDRFIESRPPFSATVAAFLNGLSPQRRGPFRSRFANLTFRQKTAVIEAMASSSEGAIRFLGSNLPGLVAFASYSEAGVFDPATAPLSRRPVGWAISGYDGVAEGETIQGYFQAEEGRCVT